MTVMVRVMTILINNKLFIKHFHFRWVHNHRLLIASPRRIFQDTNHSLPNHTWAIPSACWFFHNTLVVGFVVARLLLLAGALFYFRGTEDNNNNGDGRTNRKLFLAFTSSTRSNGKVKDLLEVSMAVERPTD